MSENWDVFADLELINAAVPYPTVIWKQVELFAAVLACRQSLDAALKAEQAKQEEAGVPSGYISPKDDAHEEVTEEEIAALFK